MKRRFTNTVALLDNLIDGFPIPVLGVHNGRIIRVFAKEFEEPFPGVLLDPNKDDWFYNGIPSGGGIVTCGDTLYLVSRRTNRVFSTGGDTITYVSVDPHTEEITVKTEGGTTVSFYDVTCPVDLPGWSG